MIALYDMIDDDEIVYGTYRVHVIFLIGQLISEFVLLALTILAMSLAGDLLSGNADQQTMLFVINMILTVVALILIGSAIVDVLRWYTKIIIVTNRRLIRREGFIQRSIVDITLHRLSQVDFTQSLIGRFLNYGNLTISGGSDMPPQELRNIARPIEFRNTIEDARVGEPPPARVTSTHERETVGYVKDDAVVVSAVDSEKNLQIWSQLEDLHQRGLLNDDELEQKRRLVFGEGSARSNVQHTDGNDDDNDDGTSTRAHSPRSGDGA
ncbi:MAG: PH domain-containing protein [Chloroflexi bacterium]|nr:PH domain-containing protein [Chloroflexota bacterium]